MDGNSNGLSTAAWDHGMPAGLTRRCAFKPADPLDRKP